MKDNEVSNVKKIVVLNSGGFDSIVLCNHVRCLFPSAKIYSLHFLYGARNEAKQLECEKYACNKLGLEELVIKLPHFFWTSGNFYKEGYDYETQYLEYRNLIFLSYALSIAEGVGADSIFIATYNGNYNDTNKHFYDSVRQIAGKSNITIETPFAELSGKKDLLPLAIKYGITKGDYFSCDVPISNTGDEEKPCGHCLDCEELKPIEEVLDFKEDPSKVLKHFGFDYSNKCFTDSLEEHPIKELRLLINNDCQLSCEHCFYGFEKMTGEILTEDEMYEVIKSADKLGIENIHFSGKEPLINDKIIYLAEKMKEDNLSCTFDVVTNGINVPKYVKRLKELGCRRIYLSVDNMDSVNTDKRIRHLANIQLVNALDCCQKEDMPVEIFIDLHKGNYSSVYRTVKSLLGELSLTCIKSFYIRTVRSLGHGKNIMLLNNKELETAFNDLVAVAGDFPDIMFSLNIGIEYENQLMSARDLNYLTEELRNNDASNNKFVLPNLFLDIESYCSRYQDTVTLTPDGYLLGCASEVSQPNYAEISAGNIRDNNLYSLIKEGKKKCKDFNKNYRCGEFKKCSFLM